MPIEAPPWATEEEIQVHGRLFLACVFKHRQHFDYYVKTGSIALPSSDRAKARLQADPVKKQRERLRNMLYNAKRAIAEAEQKLAAAREELASGSPFGWQAAEDAKKLEARLTTCTAAARRAEIDLSMFDELHPRTRNRSH